MGTTTDLPGDSTFGLEFNYATWAANTTVTMANVPWSSDYRDIVKFDSRSALDDYITANAGPTFAHMTRCNVNVPVRVSRPFNECYNYNYLRVSNGAQSAIGSTEDVFYYFVHDVRYISGNVTELVIQLDVWQTFGRSITFGNCYIERGHIGIANELQTQNNGRDYLAIPEGLDIGGEYLVSAIYQTPLGDPFSGGAQDGKAFDIIIASTIDFSNSGGTVNKPNFNTAGGSGFEGLPNGVNFYHCDSISTFQKVMQFFSTRPWVSQGIISIMAIPELRLNAGIVSDDVNFVKDDGSSESIPGCRKLISGKPFPGASQMGPADWRNAALARMGRYSNLKKFLTYPYAVVELTTYSGNPLILKPECMYGPWDSTIAIQIQSHVILPNPKIVVIPQSYNAGSIGNAGEHLDMVTGITNLPTFSSVNNAYLAFMASNSATIPYQQNSAEWSQQRALTGNQLSYDQSSVGIATSENLTEIGIRGATQTNNLGNEFGAYRAGQGALTSMGQGLMSGSPAGIAGGAMAAAGAAMTHGLNVSQNNQQLGINSGTSRAQTAAQMNQASYARDTNKSYADFAAKGDYQNTIAAINARVQDARMLQPSTSGQIGGDAYNLVHEGWNVYAKVKTLQGAALASVGEYWLRYGYQINRFGTPPASLQVMERFTYWKLRETYIRSSTCPESFRMTIRGIFEKGVTVWKNPNDIGNIDIANNAPLAGVRL